MAKKSSKPLILVDGSSFLYRAYHALPPLMNSKGEPTGAAYGVISMLRKIIKDYEPEKIAVIFDAKGKTFRDDLYKEYKATRPPMPDDLKQQIIPLHNVIKAMGLPLLIIDNVEADDVIGTLAIHAANKGLKTIIATSDKDMAQLVNGKITLVNTMTDSVLDTKGIEEKFGIPPSLIIDYLTLIGDNVDNIPGVPKVGPKTAVKWLKEYGTLDNIIKHANDIKGKVGENLRASLDSLPLSKQLVTIKKDVDLGITLNNLTPTEPNNEKLIELFSHLEFKSWLSQLLGESDSPNNKIKYETILTKDTFDKWIKKLNQSKLFAFDTETTDLNYINAKLVGVSFATENGEGAYLPFNHDYENAPKQLEEQLVLKQLKPLLESKDHTKIFQNLKYDMSVLAKYDIQISETTYDTMLESYVLNSTASRHDMDTLALKYLAHQTIHYKDIAGKGAKQLHFNEIEIDKATPYAAEDADITFQLHQKLWPNVSKDKELKFVFENIEMPLVCVLSRVERNGVLIDAKKLQKQSQFLEKRLQTLEGEAYRLSGGPFNLNSPKQLQEILFIKLKLPVLQKTPKGQPSTAENVLQDLALDYPLPKIILEYRSLNKLKTTYTDKLPQQINPQTGRVHTSYNQTVTATGRLSSTDPNLQNIPVRTEEGRKIRQAFIAPKGYKIVSADYSQIELRIMAHLSNDKGLLSAFADGLDIHKATAAEVFNVSLDKVTPDQRRSAKAINFGLIYGMSAFGLSKQLAIPREAAERYIDRYFDRYPGVKVYMEKSREHAHQKEFVSTLMGRRLAIPEINSKNMMRQKAAERAAINAPMQGTAADIIKLAMIKLDHALLTSNIDAKMVMQVHDELVFEVLEKDIDELTLLIKNHMCKAAKLNVELVVDIGVGDHWDEAH